MALTWADLEKNAAENEAVPRESFDSTIQRAITANDPN